MSAGEDLDRASDNLAQAKRVVDVMLIRRRIGKEELASAIAHTENALSRLKSIQKEKL